MKLKRITAFTNTSNIACQNLLKKAGFKSDTKTGADDLKFEHNFTD